MGREIPSCFVVVVVVVCLFFCIKKEIVKAENVPISTDALQLNVWL